MRAFACQAYSSSDSGPGLATILAEDEARAGVLARRVLIQLEGAVRVEIRENGRLVGVEAGET